MNNTFDIVVVGAGISAGYTLIHFIGNLENQKPEKPIEIAVIDKLSDFWVGVPYGSKSGRNPLIITSLKEFIPQIPEREHFKNWLNQNKSWIFEHQDLKEGHLGKKWLARHSKEINSGDWDDMFLPRYLFGIYMDQYVSRELKKAEEKKLIRLTLIQATVDNVEQMGEGYKVFYSTQNQFDQTIYAAKILLCVGSPPNIGFINSLSSGSQKEPNYIADIYEPSLDSNLDLICDVLQKTEDPTKRQILIVGSNASTLDVVYALNNSKKASALIHKFIVISPNGAFPHKISQVPFADFYCPENLIQLISKVQFEAKDILTAIQKDVAEATENKLNIADIFPEISKSMLNAVNLLSKEEQRKFIAIYAVEIGKLQRRAGHEYLEVIDELISQGRFDFVKGRFQHYISTSNGGPGIGFTRPNQSEIERQTESIALVITCAGFQNVSDTSSGLLLNLISKGICNPNDSNRGFWMNSNFETSPNFYLMGPLVAGNMVGTFRVWHAESCSRIINMSKELAGILAEKSIKEDASSVG